MGFSTCQGQSKRIDMKEKTSNTNPLLCDLETGMCEMPTNETTSATSKKAHTTEKQIRVVYFTDPICSSCWGIEPQLRKLKLEYGKYIEIEYRMGGLLPDWSYNSGGISKPSDVAHHWDEVSILYDMPIDGDVWLEDPLVSSYPPSIAFKAAQLQDQEKAISFLRVMREMVFLEKKNITKWEHISAAAQIAELNIEQLKTDVDGKAKTLFEEDLNLAREYGVRGFPTMFFIENLGNKEIVYGSKAYVSYEMVILKIQSDIIKSEYSKDWGSLFSTYPTLTAREFSELSGTPRNESEKLLMELTASGQLDRFTTKNGAMWKSKNTSR